MISTTRAVVAVAGESVPASSLRLVKDETWSPHVQAEMVVPYTPEREAALDPHAVPPPRVRVEVSRHYHGSLTVADLSAAFEASTVADLTDLFSHPEVAPTQNLATAGTLAALGTAALTTGVSYLGRTWTRVVPGASMNGARLSVPLALLVNGQPYRASVEVANSGASPVTVYIDWCDNASVSWVIPAGWSGRISAPYAAKAGGYTSTFRFIDVVSPTIGGAGVLVREFAIRPDDSVVYFDGSTPDTGIIVYGWAGTPGASASTLDGASLTVADLTAMFAEVWNPDYGLTIVPERESADLVVRGRRVNHKAATITVRVASDELLAQDAHAVVVRPEENLFLRILALLDAAGLAPDFGAVPDASFYPTVPATTYGWTQSLGQAALALAAEHRYRLWCDQARVWHLGIPPDFPDGPGAGVFSALDVDDDTDRDGDFADVLVWIAKGRTAAGVELQTVATYPDPIPPGPHKVHVHEEDHGIVTVAPGVPEPAALALRLRMLSGQSRVVTVPVPLRPGVFASTPLTLYAPLPGLSGVIARVEHDVEADTTTITSRRVEET